MFAFLVNSLFHVVAVPLRTPELGLSSHSSTDIQVSWQPLPAKISRGQVSAYRLSYRTAVDSTVTSVELPHNSTEYLLEGLQPDTIYLLRMAAATRVGWCEPSAWTSHRTPKISSKKGKSSLKKSCCHEFWKLVIEYFLSNVVTCTWVRPQNKYPLYKIQTVNANADKAGILFGFYHISGNTGKVTWVQAVWLAYDQTVLL